MNATVSEWIAKAEGGYRTAERELQPAGTPNFDAVCFHAEQGVEKLMKALLIHRGVTPPRTHSLTILSNLIASQDNGWSWPTAELNFLSRAAVDFRYPGESADRQEASEALEIARRIRARVLPMFV